MDVVLEGTDYVHIRGMDYGYIAQGLRSYARTTLISVVHQKRARSCPQPWDCRALLQESTRVACFGPDSAEPGRINSHTDVVHSGLPFPGRKLRLELGYVLEQKPSAVEAGLGRPLTSRTEDSRQAAFRVAGQPENSFGVPLRGLARERAGAEDRTRGRGARVASHLPPG